MKKIPPFRRSLPHAVGSSLLHAVGSSLLHAVGWGAVGLGLTVAISSCRPDRATVAGPDNIEITMRRTVCYGTCPAYSVTLGGDGSVAYDGEEFVAIVGQRTSTVPPEAVAALAAENEAAGFFQMQDVYTAGVTDLPTTYLTVTMGDRTKAIEDYFGAPDVLKALEARVDEVAGTAQWVMGAPPGAQP